MKEGGGGEKGKICLPALLVCLQNLYTGWTGSLIGAVGVCLTFAVHSVTLVILLKANAENQLC